MTRYLLNTIAGLTLAMAALPAAAQESAFGCRMLQDADSQALIEGQDGVFFRLNPDLRLAHPLSDAAARAVASLAEALQSRGTTLVYVPVPTKALAMPDYLPAEAADYGYEPSLAVVAYGAFLDRMREAGITVADTLPALRAEARPFIGTDFHWGTSGARAAAGAVAETLRTLPAYADVPKSEHVTESTGPRSVSSELRRRLQTHCRDSVPDAVTEGYETTEQGGEASGGGIFADETAAPPVALIGTSMSAEEAFNFAGFLADAADLALVNYAINGGNQFGSLTSYLLSEEFQNDPPRFLVWENPIYNNLGEFGALPLYELIAAAAPDCTPLETERVDDRTLAATLPDTPLDPQDLLRIDSGSANGREADFTFTTRDGIALEMAVSRPPRFSPTRWFYQPLATLGESDFESVSVVVDQPLAGEATLSICTTEGVRS